MTPDLHTLTGAYAVDALGPEERAEFERHLAECEACRDEVRGLSAAGARLGVAASAPVPAAFRDAVLAQVHQTRQLPPLVADPATDQVAGPDDAKVVALLRRSRAAARTLVAVAAALVVIAAGLGVVAARQHQAAVQARQVASQVTAVLAAPDAHVTTSGDSARVVVSPSLREAVFVPRNLPAVDADHVLQLWVIDDGARSVGLVDGSRPLLATDVGPTSKLGVTVEPAGGSKQPTTQPVAVVDLAS